MISSFTNTVNKHKNMMDCAGNGGEDCNCLAFPDGKPIFELLGQTEYGPVIDRNKPCYSRIIRIQVKILRTTQVVIKEVKKNSLIKMCVFLAAHGFHCK